MPRAYIERSLDRIDPRFCVPGCCVICSRNERQPRWANDLLRSRFFWVRWREIFNYSFLCSTMPQDKTHLSLAFFSVNSRCLRNAHDIRKTSRKSNASYIIKDKWPATDRRYSRERKTASSCTSSLRDRNFFANQRNAFITHKCLHPTIIYIQTYTYRDGHSARRLDHLELLRSRVRHAQKKKGKKRRIKEGRMGKRKEGTRIWSLRLKERGKAEVANPCKEPLYFLKEVLRPPDALPSPGP